MNFGITYHIKMNYNTFPVDHIGLKIAEYEKLIILLLNDVLEPAFDILTVWLTFSRNCSNVI